MRWLRLSFYCLPLVLAGAVYYFLSSLGFQESADEESMTFAISTEPIGVDPLTRQDPISEEIEGLLFDTLLRRGADMRVRPHLAESWSFGTRVRYFFISKKFAEQGWEAFEETEELWEGWGIGDARLEGDSIVVDLPGRSPRSAEEMHAVFPRDIVAPVACWQIRANHSAEASFRDFQKQAVEGWQARRIWSQEPGFVEVLSAGNTANFERELRLYYQSNEGLNPLVEKVEERPYVEELTMTMNLRPGVRWHDGHALTVEDVLHSLRLARDGGQSPGIVAAMRQFQEVEMRGPLSFRVHFREPMAPALEVWEQLPILQAHGWHTFSPRKAGPPLIGTGPFRIRQWEEGGPIVLERFPGYFRGEPENERIVYKQVIENRLRRILFEVNAIDAFEAEPASYRRLQLRGEFSLARGPQVEAHFVAWNTGKSVFADARVRRALACGVDYEALIDEMLDGHGEPVTGYFHPGVRMGEATLDRPIRQDLEEARSLLAEAGWNTRRYGLIYRNGEPLTFKLTLVGGDAFQRDLARALQRQWRRLDVQVQIRLASHAEISGIQAGRVDYDAVLLSDSLTPFMDQYGRWHSTEIGEGKGNYTRLRDERLDQILAAMREAFSEEEQVGLARSFQERLHALQPWAPLFLRDSARVFHQGRIVVREPVAGGGEEERAVGGNEVGLSSDLAWWVKLARPEKDSPQLTLGMEPVF